MKSHSVSTRLVRSLFLLAGSFLATSVMGDVKPSALFSDHAVLQRDVAIPVWGSADAGEDVRVEIASVVAKGVPVGQVVTTKADEKGKWAVRLEKLPAGGPYEIHITGNNKIDINDVFVGDVWLCSGQSNMEFTMSKSIKSFAGVKDEAEELKGADFPMIRQCLVEMKLSDQPQENAKMSWALCTPENAKSFSAVAYYFGRALHKELNVPIGLINSSFGASSAQAWISRDALSSRPDIVDLLQKYDEAIQKFDSAEGQADYQKKLAEWKEADEKAKAANKRGPRKPGNPHEDQHNPALLYNAMIHPILQYPIKGAIWYQGESNGVNHGQYFSTMSTLISDWRARFGSGEFPFYIVQLASYKAPASQPVQGNSQIASIRETQTKLQSLANVGTAVITDHGDAKDIHPHVKAPVGERLALLALAKTYGKQVEYSGPVFDQMKIEGDVIQINFSHTTGGLVCKGEKLLGFAVAGEDGKFEFADAKIEGDSVIVRSDKVSQPTQVRYNWADNPPGNLFNGAGLPAGLFRTK